MKNKIPNYWIFGVALLLTMQLLSPWNVAYAGVVTPPITRCNIEIGDAHISDNLLHTRALIAVKVNASSKCDKQMQDLVLTVEIYKVGFLFDHQVARKSVSVKGVVFQNRVIKNQKTYMKCRSNKWTKFYGIAYADAKVFGERMKTYRVKSENIKRFQCGN